MYSKKYSVSNEFCKNMDIKDLQALYSSNKEAIKTIVTYAMQNVLDNYNYDNISISLDKSSDIQFENGKISFIGNVNNHQAMMWSNVPNYSKDIEIEISENETLFDLMKKLAKELDIEASKGTLSYVPEEKIACNVNYNLPAFALEQYKDAGRLYKSLCEERGIEPTYIPDTWSDAKDHPTEYSNDLILKLKDAIAISEELGNYQFSMDLLKEKISNSEHISSIADTFLKVLDERISELEGIRAESINDLINETEKEDSVPSIKTADKGMEDIGDDEYSDNEI